MKMKWSWILTLVMAGFIAMIVSFGVVMFRSDSQLYEKDYYRQGEAYAQRMEDIRKGQELDFRYDRTTYRITLGHPDSTIILQGMKVLKLSQADADFSVKVGGINGKQLVIPIKELEGDDWVVELRGTIGKTPFFRKERL